MPQYGPIQVIPPGLLSFLQLKTAGRNPSTLDSNISPVLELKEWLMLQNRENLRGTQIPLTGSSGVFVATTAGDTLTVPDNEYWYLWNHTVTAGFLAGDSVQSLAAICSHPGPNAVFNLHGVAYQAAPAPASAYFAYAGGQVGGFLEPGAILGYGGGGFSIAVPGNVTVQVTALITRLPF